MITPFSTNLPGQYLKAGPWHRRALIAVHTVEILVHKNTGEATPVGDRLQTLSSNSRTRVPTVYVELLSVSPQGVAIDFLYSNELIDGERMFRFGYISW